MIYFGPIQPAVSFDDNFNQHSNAFLIFVKPQKIHLILCVCRNVNAELSYFSNADVFSESSSKCVWAWLRKKAQNLYKCELNIKFFEFSSHFCFLFLICATFPLTFWAFKVSGASYLQLSFFIIFFSAFFFSLKVFYLNSRNQRKKQLITNCWTSQLDFRSISRVLPKKCYNH